MAHRTPLTSLACAPFHSRISLGMNDLVGKRGGGVSEEEEVQKVRGDSGNDPPGPFSNLMGN